MIVDCALLPVLGGVLFTTIARARRRLFWWTLPPLAALAAANIAFHVASPVARWRMRAGR